MFVLYKGESKEYVRLGCGGVMRMMMMLTGGVWGEGLKQQSVQTLTHSLLITAQGDPMFALRENLAVFAHTQVYTKVGCCQNWR